MEVVRYKEKYLVSDKGDVYIENKKYTRKKKQTFMTRRKSNTKRNRVILRG